MTRLLAIVIIAVAAIAVVVPEARSHPLPGAPRCSIFPADSPWNQPVDGLPVARNSDILIRSIGWNAPLHPGFGAGLYQGRTLGIPFNVVSNRTQWVKVRLDPAYRRVSYRGLYPVPPFARVQGGYVDYGDRHMLIVNRDTCLDYELYGVTRYGPRNWAAVDGVVWNLASNRLRPRGWTSANAAGLPILPGLARYSDVASGSIDHALWFTAPFPRASAIYPAGHSDGASMSRALPPMGTRVRLKASVNIAHLPPQARIVARALKRYGMILADTGMPWWLAGAPDSRWHNAQVLALERLHGRDFEVVNTRSLPKPS